MQKIQAHKAHKNQRDIDIRGSPSLGYVHPEQPILPFYYPAKMKRQNLQKIRCNILCSLSQSPYLFLTLRIHIQYIAAC